MYVKPLVFFVYICVCIHIGTQTPVQRNCATLMLHILGLVLNRGSAIDKAVVGEVYKCKR